MCTTERRSAGVATRVGQLVLRRHWRSGSMVERRRGSSRALRVLDVAVDTRGRTRSRVRGRRADIKVLSGLVLVRVVRRGRNKVVRLDGLLDREEVGWCGRWGREVLVLVVMMVRMGRTVG